MVCKEREAKVSLFFLFYFNLFFASNALSAKFFPKKFEAMYIILNFVNLII